MSASPLQRINKVIKFYYDSDCNKETANKVYNKIIALKYGKV